MTTTDFEAFKWLWMVLALPLGWLWLRITGIEKHVEGVRAELRDDHDKMKAEMRDDMRYIRRRIDDLVSLLTHKRTSE